MIKIWSRLPPEQVPRSLRITDGETHAGMATAAAAAFIARNATAASSGVQHGRQQSLPTHATMSAGKAGQGVTKNRVGASLPSSTIAGRGAPFFVYSEPGLTPLSFCRLVIEMLPSLWHVVSSANLLHRKNLKGLPVFFVRSMSRFVLFLHINTRSIDNLLAVLFFISAAPSACAAYGNVRACEACFTLHQTEAALVRAERRLAVAVGGACSNRASGRHNSGGKGADSGGGSATRRQAESRGGGVDGRGSSASSPQRGVPWSSGCGGGGRRGVRGSRGAGGLGEAARRQSASAFFGEGEVSTLKRLRTLCTLHHGLGKVARVKCRCKFHLFQTERRRP